MATKLSLDVTNDENSPSGIHVAVFCNVHSGFFDSDYDLMKMAEVLKEHIEEFHK